MGVLRDLTTPREGSRELPTDPVWAMAVGVLPKAFLLEMEHRPLKPAELVGQGESRGSRCLEGNPPRWGN